MSWPPVTTAAPLQNFKGTGGVTTPAIGTDGIVIISGTACIAKSIQPKRDVENIFIEQGSGLKANLIQLTQGTHFLITMEDDRSVPWVDVGGQLTVASDMLGTGTATGTAVCRVLEHNGNAERKQNFERIYEVEVFTTGI